MIDDISTNRTHNFVVTASDCENTDRQIWIKNKNHALSPSIHVTKSGGIGIDVGGHVIVMPVEKWHALGMLRCALDDVLRAV